jgi:hypothetical protein
MGRKMTVGSGFAGAALGGSAGFEELREKPARLSLFVRHARLPSGRVAVRTSPFSAIGAEISAFA